MGLYTTSSIPFNKNEGEVQVQSWKAWDRCLASIRWADGAWQEGSM